MSDAIFSGSMPLLSGAEQSLDEFQGRVVLVVNTASHCGFTSQYAGLEKLHQQYAEQGLTVLGFPCNQFGKQEPGSDGEISQFCQKNYGVSFPMFSKVDVNGPATTPLYQRLKNAAPGVLGTEAIKWNFTKFLIGRDGSVLNRFAPTTKPESIVSEIEKALSE